MRLPVRRGMLDVLLLITMLACFTLSAHAGNTSASVAVYLPMITDGTSVEAQVLALVNEQRRLAGCNVDLRLSPSLTAAAYRHSRDMAINNFFSHTGSDQSSMVTRATDAGYSFLMLAENLQAGATSPQEVVNGATGWMHSDTHRANILNCSLRETGIGLYYQADDQPLPGSQQALYYYWTQDFGTPLQTR